MQDNSYPGADDLRNTPTADAGTVDVTGDIGGLGDKTEKKKKKDKEKKKKNIPLRVLIIVLCLALLFGTYKVLMGIKPDNSGEEIPEEFITPEYLKGRTMNILICGLDIAEDRKEYMTDVILMVNFDIEAKQASLLQIPRDTYVGQELVPYGKINGLYNWGFSDVLPEAVLQNRSIRPLIETIHAQLKLPTDNYVMITMEGFRKAIDLIGGVEITVDEDVDFENLFELKAGESYTLNGETAEVFIRYRATYEQADLQRLRMQQVFMQALMKKIMSLSISDMISVATNIFPDLDTGFTIQELIDLARIARELEMSAITVIRVPGEPVSAYGLYGVDVFSVHKKALADLLNEHMRPYQDDVPESELGIIELVNSTDSTIEWGGDVSNLTEATVEGASGEEDGGTE